MGLKKRFLSTNSIIINAPLPRVLKASLDYPYFVSVYSHKKNILGCKKINVEAGIRILFFETRWTGVGLITQRTIRYRQTSGALIGLISEWLFKEENDYTKVTIKASFNRNILIGFIFLLLLSWLLKRILLDLKHYVLTKI